jgi:hypothetical protein
MSFLAEPELKGRGKRFNEKEYRAILREIKAGSKDYQLLCANCNWIKKYEKGEGVFHSLKSSA